MPFRSVFRSLQAISMAVPWWQESAAGRSRILRRFWWDGVLARLSDAFVVDYVPLFALTMGAGPREIGWLNGLAQLIYAALLIPGARLAERWGHRKALVMVSVGLARANLLLWALMPFFLSGPPAVRLIVLTGALRVGLWGLGLPAWTSLAGDWVPREIRGRYFGWRNIGSGLAALAGVAAAGAMITALGGVQGYQAAFAIAFLVGGIGWMLFASIPEIGPGVVRGKRLPPWREVRQQPAFLRYLAMAGTWNFAVFLAGPFFNVHLVRNLRADARTVGLLSMVSTLTALLGQWVFGRWSDRIGAPRGLLWAGVWIPLLPWAWLLARSPWHVLPINALAGFLWAGFELCSLNTLLAFSPPETRPRYAALYNLVSGISAALGAATGGWIAAGWGFYPLFALSGFGRALAIGVYRWKVLPCLSEGDLQKPSGSEGDPSELALSG